MVCLSGFISLDCGRLPKNASYTEPTIGINYVSDEPYIDSGESKSIQTEYKAVLQEQASFVRAFPEGIRNCYRIGVPKNTKYLIRGSFVYGNYDGLNQLPEFDLYLGVSFWSTVKIEYVDFDVQKEMVHVAQQDFVRVCLVNTGLGTPFISALELRPLSNASYVTPSVSLSLVLRADILGSTSNGSVYRSVTYIYVQLGLN